MRTKDVTKVLKLLGWSVGTDEVGDKFATLDLDDRKVNIIYSVQVRPDFERLVGMCAVSTNAFSAACSSIDPGFGQFAPLITTHDFQIEELTISEDDVENAVKSTIYWAKEQDIGKALSEFANLPTSSPGTGPVLHLAALVVTGKLETLNYYLNSFEKDDRLGFVPYITKEHIERAAALVGSEIDQSKASL